MQAVGLQTHIWNNNVRSTLLLAGFPVLLLVITYVVIAAAMFTGVLPVPEGGDPAMEALSWMAGAAPLALVVSAVWFAVAYFANTAIIARATGARPVSRTEQPELYNLLENLAISRGLPMPKLNIIDSPALNAFASGLNKKQYTVTVTTGLVEALQKDELEAVLAHEMTHIINSDVRTMVVASVFAGIFTLITELLFRSLRFASFTRNRNSKGGAAVLVFMLIALAAVALGRLMAVVIRMTLSRTREFVADAGAAELTKNPDAMIRALQKVSGQSTIQAPSEVRGLFLDNHSTAAFGLFSTHPPIEKRITALEKFAGGRRVAAPIVETAKRGPWG